MDNLFMRMEPVTTSNPCVSRRSEACLPDVNDYVGRQAMRQSGQQCW